MGASITVPSHSVLYKSIVDKIFRFTTSPLSEDGTQGHNFALVKYNEEDKAAIYVIHNEDLKRVNDNPSDVYYRNIGGRPCFQIRIDPSYPLQFKIIRVEHHTLSPTDKKTHIIIQIVDLLPTKDVTLHTSEGSEWVQNTTISDNYPFLDLSKTIIELDVEYIQSLLPQNPPDYSNPYTPTYLLEEVLIESVVE